MARHDKIIIINMIGVFIFFTVTDIHQKERLVLNSIINNLAIIINFDSIFSLREIRKLKTTFEN